MLGRRIEATQGVRLIKQGKGLLRPDFIGTRNDNKGGKLDKDISCWWGSQGAYPGLEAGPEP